MASKNVNVMEIDDYVFDEDLDVDDEEVVDSVMNVSVNASISSPVTDIDASKCLWCQMITDEPLSVLGRGLQTFQQYCQAIDRFDLLQYVLSRPGDRHVLHRSCNRAMAYAARKASDAVSSKSSKPVPTRSKSGVFLVDEMCFLCGQYCMDSKDLRKVAGDEDGFDKYVRQTIRERKFDEWAVAVEGRMNCVNDLFSVDAVYHLSCKSRFSGKLPHTPHKLKRGRPRNDAAQVAFEQLCTKLEQECDNEMYTLTELHTMMVELIGNDEAIDLYGKKYLKKLLQDRYGVHIYFASRPGRDDVVGFSKFCDWLLHNKFFTDRSEGEGSEAERLVKKAAGLVKAELREMCYSRDFYPTTEEIAGDGLSCLPPLLKMFIEQIISSPVKQSAVGQCIVQAARPQGCLMPLLFGVGVDLDSCGVQDLHIKLSRLGFCLTVEEIRRYKQSVMQSHTIVNNSNTNMETDLDSNLADVHRGNQEPVTHFVADNVDHNVRTLDGLNTFHGMGIISTTVCPVSHGKFGKVDKLVPRLAKPMKAAEATQNKCAPVLAFNMTDSPGVGTVKFGEIDALMTPLKKPSLLYINFLWAASDIISPNQQLRPNWSGYMQTVFTGDHNGVSSVEMLSIIDLNPSDTDCVYSTLMFVINQAKHLCISSPDITFDQPLYIKAVDIAYKANLDIVVRLGGFHTLMSFLGSIGHLMKGSGLEDVLGVIFGPNTVEHILSGKAYARAVRGHLLIYKALTALLVDFLKCDNSVEESLDDDMISPVSLPNNGNVMGSLTPSIISALNELYSETLVNGFSNNDDSLLYDTNLVKANLLFEELKSALHVQSRTARLWILYMKCIDLVKLFLLAERTSNWELHLHVVYNMLPIFAATGHANYAKCGRLYLQQMHDLSATHPRLHSQFLNGHHTVRRSDRLWSGLSMDLVIEQTMMRDVKSRGGLTRGRGLHESVRTTWLSTMTSCGAIRSALSSFVSFDKTVTEHIETGISRRRRDVQDYQKVKAFLSVYSPFKYVDSARLISLSSGLVAGIDDEVDCEKAEEIGSKVQKKWDQTCFADLTLKKAEQVKTMAHLSNTCTIESDKVNIDPNTLFHRLIIAGERFDNLRDCFSYELTPYPMSLFKAGLMRKPDKASLYRDFVRGMTDAAKPSELTYVVDGGYLLHKVRWSPTMNVCDVLPLFLNHLKRLGKCVSVVFDGYNTGPSIKDPEHARRSLKARQVATDRQINLDTKNIGNQDAFLCNTNNKMGLINVLSDYLRLHSISTYHATDDADTLIVSVALEKASLSENVAAVAVVAEDTDILALLLFHRQHDMKDIFFISESKTGRGGKTLLGKCISINLLQNKLGPHACAHILTVHAMGGCDSTSAIFGLGKGAIFNNINKDVTLHDHCMTLQCETASADDVCSSGVRIMGALYGGKDSESLATLRYAAFVKSSLSRRFMAERLPPSESAAKVHAKRVHLQAVIWATLGKTKLLATDWGWKLLKGRLTPITLDGPVAPDNVLNVIRCKCKGNCSSTSCSCRKHGLQCVTACSKCHGTECTNVQMTVNSSDNDTDDDSDDCESEPVTTDLGQFFFDDEFNLNVQYDEEV